MKKDLCELERCYAVAQLTFDEKPFLLYASEAKVGEPYFAYAFPLDDLEKREIVWDHAGGCMGMSALPGKKNQFLAVQEFYLKQTPSQAKLVWVERKGKDSWEVQDYVALPFLHRFGIMEDEGESYLIACTIAQDKKDKDDWSLPGEIWWGKIGTCAADGIQLTKLKSGLYRNHGFYHQQKGGRDYFYIGCDQGLYRLYREQHAFQFEKLLDVPVGEAAVADIDHDGEDEILTIEPFHGNAICLYHKNKAGRYEKVWNYDGDIDFAHALIATTIAGTPVFAAGVRRKQAEMFLLWHDQMGYRARIIDQGGGPANLCAFSYQGVDGIAAANHTANSCTIYTLDASCFEAKEEQAC